MSTHEEGLRSRLDVLNQAPFGLAVWDLQGRVVFSNDAFSKLIGTEVPTEALERALGGETVSVPARTFTDPEGRCRSVSMLLFPMRDAAGLLTHVGGTYRDETEALLASERFRLAEQAGRFGTFEWNAESGFTMWSQQLDELYGFARDGSKLDRDNWTNVIHPDDRAVCMATIDAAFAKQQPVEAEYRILRKDGSTRWVVGRFLAATSPEGKRLRLIGVNVDITERKDAEARFQKLVDAGIIGVTVSDREGRFHFANDAFLEMVGYSREDFLHGRVKSEDLNLKSRSPEDLLAVTGLRERGIAGPWEKELVRKDGAHVPVLVGALRLDATEEVIAFILDLSERKRAEDQRAAVMEAALDAILMMDQDGTIIEFNPAAERAFGYSRSEVIGKELADIVIPPRLRPTHREGLKRYRETGKGPILGNRVESTALRKDGTEFPAEIAIVPVRFLDKTVFTGYVRDITERRRAAESELLQREKEAAQAANRELEAFSYSVAHDLRAPLRGINGFAGVLLEDYGNALDETGRAHLSRITNAASRMGHIIDSLLDLARVSRAELRVEPLDLARKARSIIELLRAAEPGRAVTFVTDETLPARGDASLIRTVLENLLGNAWKFTRKQEHPRIELGCRVVDGETQYFVRDNGAGFDMRFVNQLFKAFQRLHESEQFEGTGVGLATVQRVIHRHGGRVWAEGKESEGAAFFFTLGST